jgi:hypothetical protein
MNELLGGFFALLLDRKLMSQDYSEHRIVGPTQRTTSDVFLNVNLDTLITRF